MFDVISHPKELEKLYRLVLHTLNLLRNLPRSEISPAESPNRRYREKISCGISRGAKFLLQNLLIGDTGRKSPAESPAERKFSRGISRRAEFLPRNLPERKISPAESPAEQFSPAESPGERIFSRGISCRRIRGRFSPAGSPASKTVVHIASLPLPCRTRALSAGGMHGSPMMRASRNLSTTAKCRSSRCMSAEDTVRCRRCDVIHDDAIIYILGLKSNISILNIFIFRIQLHDSVLIDRPMKRRIMRNNHKYPKKFFWQIAKMANQEIPQEIFFSRETPRSLPGEIYLPVSPIGRFRRRFNMWSIS